MRPLFVLAALALCACTCGKRTCVDDAGCPSGDVCGAEGVCVAPTLVAVVVSDPAARGCELLLGEQAGAEVGSARFQSGAKGTHLREAPRVAVVFVAAKDQPLASGDVQLALTRGAASGLSIEKASCVDSAGQRLPNATVSLR